jgi:regulatory protein
MTAKRARPKDAQGAYDAAARILGRGAFGFEGLVAKLVAKGFDENIAREGVQRLKDLGLLDESASAEAIVHATTRDLPAGEALIRARLEQRGVDTEAADDALRDASTQRDEALDAKLLARQALLRMPSTLDDGAKARRLLGLLARRGFTEDHALDAVRALVPGAFEHD